MPVIPSTVPVPSTVPPPSEVRPLSEAAPRVVSRQFFQERYRRVLLVVAVLAASGVVITRGIHTGEFNFNTDETIHASTGLYFADFVRDLPLRHPMQYTLRYYGQYPALGVLHWPPIFHMVEGLGFLLFGSSVVVARGALLLFALLGIYFLFRLVEYVESTPAAVIASLLFAFLPLTLLYEKVVMLEIPALSFAIGALFFWIRYLREEKRPDIYWFALLACAALLTKQTAAFLLPVSVLSAVLTKRVQLFLQKTTWYVAAGCGIVLAPYYLAMSHYHGAAMAKVLGNARPVSHFARYTFYWRILPEQMTWVVLGLSVLGIVTYCLRQEWEKLAFAAAWICACYLTMTPIGVQEPRFAIYWLPAWAWLAAVPFTVRVRQKVLRPLQPVAAVVLLSVQAGWALSFHRPYVEGYQTAAGSLVRMAKSGYVLFDGPLPGNFVFFVRTSDPDRRVGVLRKALYVTMLEKRSGSEELVHGFDGIRNLLEDDGVRYIVVAENAPIWFPVQQTLRDLLHSDHQFQLRATFPVHGGEPMQPDTYLAIYENLEAPATPVAQSLHFKMLTTTRKDFDVPITTLGPPQHSFHIFGR